MIVGIGCDLVEITRLKPHQEDLAKRVLTLREYALYQSFTEERALEFLAGRFAAKEAVFKAIQIKTLTLVQIEILAADNGCPVCLIEGYRVHVTISHERHYAMAYVMIEK